MHTYIQSGRSPLDIANLLEMKLLLTKKETKVNHSLSSLENAYYIR